MKKYRIKEKFFGHQPGQTIVTDKNNQFILGTIDPSTYPHAFEEIKEPSDEEVLAGWLCDIAFGGFYSRWEPIITSLTKALIAKGFDVSKLREGM